jgi:ribose transport system ATP-binding protein
MSTLSVKNITKDYPGCRALDSVSVKWQSGKVNALLGKNGSGKSTLIKCVAGAVMQTKGEIFLDGVKLDFSSPAEAYEQGIGVVYQEMSLIPGLSVTENIFLGRMPKKGRIIDWKTAHIKASQLLKRMNVDINPREIISRLSMWQCQVVEITKALSFEPTVLILDEPTSALATHEVKSLFEAIREIKKQDVIIVYISHKLNEIPQIADTVTVLRDGFLIDSVKIEDTDQKGIIHMMFGDVEIAERPTDLKVGKDTVLSVKNLSSEHKFSDVSFDLKSGEVLGIAGMLGSGRTELLKSIFGADPYDSGEVFVKGKKMPHRSSPILMKKMGLALTPEDRKLEGLILIHSIQDNLCYASLDKTAPKWIENHKLQRQISHEQVEGLEIKLPDIMNTTSSLSGGNQQKVVVGNWLNTKPEIMLYDEPSRGIDVKAKQQIFDIMWQQSRKGISSIFVSSELEELLEVCHRIIIMREGEMIGEVNSDDIEIQELYTLCMGEE